MERHAGSPEVERAIRESEGRPAAAEPLSDRSHLLAARDQAATALTEIRGLVSELEAELARLDESMRAADAELLGQQNGREVGTALESTAAAAQDSPERIRALHERVRARGAEARKLVRAASSVTVGIPLPEERLRPGFALHAALGRVAEMSVSSEGPAPGGGRPGVRNARSAAQAMMARAELARRGKPQENGG